MYQHPREGLCSFLYIRGGDACIGSPGFPRKRPASAGLITEQCGCVVLRYLSNHTWCPAFQAHPDVLCCALRVWVKTLRGGLAPVGKGDILPLLSGHPLRLHSSYASSGHECTFPQSWVDSLPSGLQGQAILSYAPRPLVAGPPGWHILLDEANRLWSLNDSMMLSALSLLARDT